MKDVREQNAVDAPGKAGVGLSVLLVLSTVVLSFVITGVVALVVREVTVTSFTFYGFAILWLVLSCAGIFAASRMLHRRTGLWTYLSASVIVIVLLLLLALPGYLAILL